MRLRTGSLILVLTLLGGMRLVGASGSLDGFQDVLRKARTGAETELEGPLSPVGDWLYSQRAGDRGVVTAHSYARALEQAENLRALTAQESPQVLDATWSLMGPTNIGGRVVELAVDPTELNTIFAATASGGVWKSTTAGETWTYSWSPTLTQAMGAIAIASDGTIYAGTGEANPGGGSIVWGGTGMYRSRDGGATWQPIGLEDSGAIGRIAVDPANPSRVFVASAGHLYKPGGERGFYTSADGGDSWNLLLAGENATTGAIDVAIDPTNANNILVAMWDHHRLPTHRMYAGVGSGVFLSRDGGQTWQEGTLPNLGITADQVGRIGVTFAPSDPTRAYAVVASKADGTGVGFWRSNDGGATWSKTGGNTLDPAGLTGVLGQSSYGWWFGKIWVDPKVKDRLFLAGLELLESVDAGENFRPHSTYVAGVYTGAHQALVHADQHAMVWDPQVPGRVYLGNDGGVYRSNSNGTVGSWTGSAVQGWTQHYSVGVSQQRPGRVVSGLQDNMCQRSWAAGEAGHAHTWVKFSLCGDGLQTLISPADDEIVYACSQYGACNRGTGGGVALTAIGGTTGRKGWWAPLQFDPTNPSVMYYGSNVLHRSTNGGQNFTPISDDLTGDPEQLDPNNGYRIYGVITWVAAAKSDPNVIYVGTDTGKLWRTSDLGNEWVELSDADGANDLPGSWVTRVAVDPADANVAYATFSGFRSNDFTPHVVKTTDGGITWKNISGNLPSAPVNEIVVIPGGRLALGTDVGVFLSSDGGATWLTLGSNMPAVPVLDLEYHEASNTITAATFGHGIQRVALPS